MSQSLQAPASRQKQFMDLYRQGKHKLAMIDAEKLVLDYPEDAFVWKALGNCQLQIAPDEAKETLERAYSLDPDDPLTLTALARACFMAGEKQRAQALQARSIELDSGNAQAHFNMGHMLYHMGSYSEAEKSLSKAEELGHSPAEVLAMRSVILSLHFKFKEGLEALNRLYALRPEDPTVHNTLGNYHKDMADFRKAEWHYREALRLRPDYSGAYSNEILTKHYDPEASAESILQKSKKWSTRFKPPQTFDHGGKAKSPNRRLRVGLLSGNLRAHPVGWMISSALEQLPDDIELHAYSDTDAGDNDPIAARIKKACEWKPVYHLNHRQLAERIFEDDIDILIELAGHGGLNRLPTVDTKPAPIIVKWVGMQISSMGIDAFDYFLSDSHETPAGVDHLYTEKLIRLPDDYICYQPPSYKPAITALPSLTNGYITFGCFNNPAKVNDTLLAEWAILLQQLPGSRLFLKGGQYSSDEVCERVLTTLEKHGVERSRVLLEGPSQHKELLESYNRVDIALDTWPYSGGLTTCEALLMGVPVVTHTGPTFAGRHSATHLCNAGMPELVTDNWDDYRKRVLDLASDLPSLAVIRAALRTYLEQSPICDAPKFGRHLHKTLRGIWQRYCEDKAPAALTFNKGGQAWFEDEAKPVKLPIELQHGFDWNLESPVTILDNGAGIAMRSDAKELLGSGNIAVLVFDPTDALGNAEELAQYGEIQHFPHVTLGSGQPTTLRGVEGENDITSLKPLASGIADSLQTLEIPSIALDSIEGLESLDVLALDDRHDNLAILGHGAKALEKALLLQIRVRFNPTHEDQADLGSLIRYATDYGFRFHCFHKIQYRNHPDKNSTREDYSETEWVSADALLIPSNERISTLTQAQKAKFSFLLHTLYGLKNIATTLLDKTEQQGYTNSSSERPESNNKPVKEDSFDWQHLISEMLLSNRPLNREPHNLPGELIVSLTSYPERFSQLWATIMSLIYQTVEPSRVVLWIANEDKDLLPENVIALANLGLEIHHCDDIHSYKKILPTLKRWPEAYVATADDDIYYPPTWLEEMVRATDINKKTIAAHRIHKIQLNQFGEVLPYNKWEWNTRRAEKPDPLNFPTSGAGILYPPNCFHSDVNDIATFTKLCPNADDVWLYAMARIKGYSFKHTGRQGFMTWPGSQSKMLFEENLAGGNDRQINQLIQHYPIENIITGATGFIIEEQLEQNTGSTTKPENNIKAEPETGRNAFNVKNYWNERYKLGGNSGAGSYGRLAIFKAEVINSLLRQHDIKNLIEFGCGDGNQISLFDTNLQYYGIDISEKSVSICRKKFTTDTNKKFSTVDEFSRHPEIADATMSLDVIYHLVDDDLYHQYMKNLFMHARKLCIVYSANIEERTHDSHVRKRNFTDWVKTYANDWLLVETIPNKYPMIPGSNPNETSFADFYIFRKQEQY
ncbi:MAG: hypothetical protein HRU39_12720 [Salinicola sp.]|uniref:O-linked N-acetylglucosamine transferase family protein n=1 Tax=Salinicola sp. TaxID=1978524 RepID=UPI001D2D84C2|nr:methyltransferase domain-containing protein [Salinicola sp.]NRB56821.1 hypothetical protein [Salinicola sp.]